MHSTTSTNLSLKWNNEIQESFVPRRGLHQGDHMSLYLYFLYAEASPGTTCLNTKKAIMSKENVGYRRTIL